MKKNGYTIVELLILIVFLGVVTFIVINKESHAFSSPTIEDKLSNTESDKKDLIVFAAEKYAKDNSELFKDKNEIKIKVNDLVTNNYLTSDNDGKVIDEITKKELNDLEIKIVYDKENDVYKAVILE